MNINKKFDRMKQWAGERMGGEVKTNVSDGFKALEAEMQLRHEGSFSGDLDQRSAPIDSGRLGEDAEGYEHLCQGYIETQRRRR